MGAEALDEPGVGFENLALEDVMVGRDQAHIA
jgi:hypothetical protein